MRPTEENTFSSISTIASFISGLNVKGSEFSSVNLIWWFKSTQADDNLAPNSKSFINRMISAIILYFRSGMISQLNSERFSKLSYSTFTNSI